jgi:hypothetical protein
MSKTVQIRDIPDETYQRLRQQAAEAGMSVPEYLKRTAERLAHRPTVSEWVERTRQRGGPSRESDSIATLDELRGPWPTSQH